MCTCNYNSNKIYNTVRYLSPITEELILQFSLRKAINTNPVVMTMLLFSLHLACLLFSDGEPHIDNTQSYQVHTCLIDRKAWAKSHKDAIVVLMIDNGVTNLCGKTLSKLIYCFLVMLIKLLSFSINMLFFLKMASMHVPGIFRMKSNLLNMFNLIKLYAIR